MSTSLQNASQLGDLLAQLPLNQPEQWSDIQSTAQSLANELRATNVEQQAALGQTLLPQTLNGLLKGAIQGTPVPDPGRKQAIYEILRVGANLCRDHDENRGALLEAGFPQTVVSLLEGYLETVKPSDKEPLDLSIPDLQIVKTAIGVLLNTSIGYEPVKTRLISLEAVVTILKLSIAIYPPGSWLKETHVPIDGSEETKNVVESWNLRSSLTAWALSAITELEEDDDNENDRPRQLFTADILPHISRTLAAFVPPYPSPPPLFSTPDSRQSLVRLDFQLLEETSGLFETLALDEEESKIALARGFVSPSSSDDVPVLSRMLDFIEHADYPPYWKAPSGTSTSKDEYATRTKGFDMCKAAVIKAVVEVAGEDMNTDVLWDDTQEGKPGGEFVDIMVRWIRDYKNVSESKRDDLLIAALVNIGNLCRKDSHSIAIVNPPIALVPDLVTLLEPTTDVKVLHGLVGLLKHLATSPKNRAPLGRAGVLQKLAFSQVIHPKTDSVELLQMSGIGLAKHMCNLNVDNSFAVVLPNPSSPDDRPLIDYILELGRRSNSTAIKSESTRVAVNAIKALWTQDITSDDPSTFPHKRDEARKALINAKCAAAFAQLIGRSRKYPMLVNEGVVALTLLSTGENGGAIALDALMNPLPVEVSSQRQNTIPMSAGGILAEPMSVDGSPASSSPRRAFDMLVNFLHNVPFNFQPNTRSASATPPTEVRANICSLLGHLGRNGVVINRERDVEVMKDSTKSYLEGLANNPASEAHSRSAIAAKRALEAWAKT